jgi:IS30 family transposase
MRKPRHIPKRRLSEEQQIECMKLYAWGVPQSTLAKRFGVHPSTMSQYIARQRRRPKS